MQCCQTEFDTRTLENGELSKLQAAYNHQLEEQVALAKLDIVNALQEQIQVASSHLQIFHISFIHMFIHVYNEIVWNN